MSKRKTLKTGPDIGVESSSGEDLAREDLVRQLASSAHRRPRKGPPSQMSRIPPRLRQDVDRAIFAQQTPLDTYERISEHFQLEERYGIRLCSVQRYGQRLWWQRDMAEQRALAIETLGDHQFVDWQRFARNGGMAVANTLLEFFFARKGKDVDPNDLKQPVANFVAAYKAWIQAEAVIARIGDPDSDSRDPSDGDSAPASGFDPELLHRIKTEIYGLPEEDGVSDDDDAGE